MTETKSPPENDREKYFLLWKTNTQIESFEKAKVKTNITLHTYRICTCQVSNDCIKPGEQNDVKLKFLQKVSFLVQAGDTHSLTLGYKWVDHIHNQKKFNTTEISNVWEIIKMRILELANDRTFILIEKKRKMYLNNFCTGRYFAQKFVWSVIV